MKEYVKPMMTSEEFTANEFVSACGDSGVTYKFLCNAGVENEWTDLYYYKDENSTSATKLGNFQPCPSSHVAESTDDFFDGFVDYNDNGIHDDGESVIVWHEVGTKYEEHCALGHCITVPVSVDNWHATAQLDQSKWETAKS